MSKDWTGDTNSIFKTLGASSHCNEDRQTEDFYATEPNALKKLIGIATFEKNIWECACGQGHLSNVLIEAGFNVRSTDLIYRGYGEKESFDFLSITNCETFYGDIITNPPYKYAQEFVEKALDIVADGHRVAMFLKLQFLEGKKRKELFRKFPPYEIYVSSSRLLCGKNGDFSSTDSSAVAYAWFIWIKGYSGETKIKWFN